MTHETARGDHDFCLSRSHYTDTDPTSRERAPEWGSNPRHPDQMLRALSTQLSRHSKYSKACQLSCKKWLLNRYLCHILVLERHNDFTNSSTHRYGSTCKSTKIISGNQFYARHCRKRVCCFILLTFCSFGSLATRVKILVSWEFVVI